MRTTEGHLWDRFLNGNGHDGRGIKSVVIKVLDLCKSLCDEASFAGKVYLGPYKGLIKFVTMFFR